MTDYFVDVPETLACPFIDEMTKQQPATDIYSSRLWDTTEFFVPISRCVAIWEADHNLGPFGRPDFVILFWVRWSTQKLYQDYFIEPNSVWGLQYF
jgi:hypothetical protein